MQLVLLLVISTKEGLKGCERSNHLCDLLGNKIRQFISNSTARRGCCTQVARRIIVSRDTHVLSCWRLGSTAAPSRHDDSQAASVMGSLSQPAAPLDGEHSPQHPPLFVHPDPSIEPTWLLSPWQRVSSQVTLISIQTLCGSQALAGK